jgi:hypothetical protein
MGSKTKKIVVASLVILVAIGGFVAGLVLLQERQDIREEAAVPGGQATVSITPEDGSFEVGSTFQATVSFNTASIPVSGVAVRLTYPFSGASPELQVTDININSALLSSGDWSCPTKNASEQGGTVFVDIACANTSASGFSTSTNFPLATIDFRVDRATSISPLTVRFDPQNSIITQQSTGEDILLIPLSTGSYEIGGGATPTPTPEPTNEPGVTSTPTPTSTITTTPTSTPSATPTIGDELPDAGVSLPTMLGLGLGTLMLIFAIMLAL